MLNTLEEINKRIDIINEMLPKFETTERKEIKKNNKQIEEGIIPIYENESNERLIKRKGMIGKIVGFAPMVGLFVGYLIVPLVAIGLTSMTSSFSSVQGM